MTAILRAFLRYLSLVTLALRRLFYQRALTLCMLMGMSLAVALAVAIPAYVNVAQANVLRQRLQQAEGDSIVAGPRSPFSLLFTFISFDAGKVDAKAYDVLNEYAQNARTRAILPVNELYRTISTDRFRVYSSGNSVAKYELPKEAKEESLFNRNRTIVPPYLFFASFDVIEGIESHIEMDEGRAPGGMQQISTDKPVEVMIERQMANKYGIVAGDAFTVAVSYRETVNDENGSTLVERFIPLPITVTGIWNARDAREDFWTLAPASMRESFLIPEDVLRERVMRTYPYVVTLALWNLQLDSNSLTVDAVDPLLSRAATFKREIFQINPSFKVSSRVIDALADYRKSANELNLVLTIFSLPAFAMVIYFLALISGMVVRQQEAELAILQSRGSSSVDVFLLYLIQSLLLGIAALGLGLVLGLAVAGMIANTRSFLEFSFDRTTFEQVFRVTPPVLRTAVYAALAAVVITLLPVLSTARGNIISHGVGRARSLRKPFWQRAFLDVLLLIPCVYSYIQLRQRGSLATITTQLERAGELGATVARLTASDDPFRDPVRFLVPVLTVTALGLLAARLLPVVVGILARVLSIGEISRGPLLPVFLALRELARSPGDYIAPLVLLIFTLGVAIFGASAARTLDQHLRESTLLQVGGDTRLIENGESNKPPPGPFAPPPSSAEANKPELWTFPPVENHLLIPGVRNYARVAEIRTAPQALRVEENTIYKVYAVDRRQFHDIAASAFRADYATRSFGELMNSMGKTRSGLLAPQRFLSENGLSIGDTLILKFSLDATPVNVTYTVRGGFTYFPIAGVNDTDVGFVTDIGYTFEWLGKEVPYEVLLATEPSTDGREVASIAVEKHDFLVSTVEDTRAIMLKEQARPERQGMFGMLSASFVFVTLLTLTGFAVYALLSFRRRSIEIGVMRAMGLSAGQMSMYVVFLQTFIVVLGAAIGGGIGLLVSRLFVPFLQIGGSLIQSVPSFFVRVAWQDTLLFYIALTIALVAVLVGSLIFLRRLKVFEVVKLGATN